MVILTIVESERSTTQDTHQVWTLLVLKSLPKSSVSDRIDEYARIHDALILNRSQALIGTLSRVFEAQDQS